MAEFPYDWVTFEMISNPAMGQEIRNVHDLYIYSTITIHFSGNHFTAAIKITDIYSVDKVYTYLSPDTEYFHGRHLPYY